MVQKCRAQQPLARVIEVRVDVSESEDPRRPTERSPMVAADS